MIQADGLIWDMGHGRVWTSDAVETVPMNWPGYSKLRLRLRKKPYQSRDAVNGVNAVTAVTGVTGVTVVTLTAQFIKQFKSL